MSIADLEWSPLPPKQDDPALTSMRPRRRMNRRAARDDGAHGLLARTGWTGFGSVTALGAHLLLTPYLLHELGLDRYGIWALMCVIVTFVSAVDGGVGASLAFFFALHRGRRDIAAASRLVATAIVLFVGMGAVLTLALGAGMPAILRITHVPAALRGEALSLRFLVGALVTTSFLSSVFTALLQAHDRFRAIGLIAASRVVTMVGGTVVCMEAGGGLRALVLVNLASWCLTILLSALVGRPYWNLKDAAPVRRDERKTLWSYASRMQLSSITFLVNMELDALIIGLLVSVRYVGIYTIAANVAMALKALPMYALRPLFTRFAVRYADGGLEEAGAAYRSVNPTWFGAVTAYTAIGVVSVGFGVRAWLGPLHMQSGYVAAIVFAGYGVNLLTGVASTFGRAIGRPGLETRYALWATGINLCLTLPFGLAFGLYGVIGATAIGNVIGSMYFFRILRRSVPEDLGSPWSDIRLLRVGAAAVATLLGELAVLSFGLSGPGGLALTCLPAAIGLGLYGWFSRETILGMTADTGSRPLASSPTPLAVTSGLVAPSGR